MQILHGLVFLLTIKKNAPFKREEFLEYLEQKKIGTRLLFSGNITKQPYMKNYKYKILESLKNSDFIMNNSFWIGVYPGLKEKHLNYVVEQFKNYLEKFS